MGPTFHFFHLGIIWGAGLRLRGLILLRFLGEASCPAVRNVSQSIAAPLEKKEKKKKVDRNEKHFH